MRSALLLILLSAPLWATGNTCTLKKSFNCSGGTCSASQIVADSGNAYFTGSGCTAAGYTIASDFLIIPDTVTFTDNVGWAYGNSGKGAESYVSSITVGGTIPGGSGTCTITPSGGTVIDPGLSMGLSFGLCTYAGGVVSVRGNSCVASCTPDFPMPWYTAASSAPTATISCAPTACGSATVTVNWHQGSGQWAIYTNNTGVFICAAPITIKGSAAYLTDFGNSTAWFEFSPGCAITVNSSAAASLTDGTKPIYGIGPDETSQFGKRTIGTVGPCTVSTCSITSTPASKSGFIQYGQADGGYTIKGVALSNLGSVSFGSLQTYALNTLSLDLENSTMTNCGAITDGSGFDVPDHLTFSKNTHSGTIAAQGSLKAVFINFQMNGNPVATFKGNVFDIAPFYIIPSTALDWEDNYVFEGQGFNMGGNQAPAVNTHNLEYFTTLGQNASGSGNQISGSTFQNYEVIDTPDGANPHILQWNILGTPLSVSGIAEMTDSLNGDSGEFVVISADPGSTTGTYTVSNVMMLPNAVGYSWGEFASIPGIHFIQQYNHNYWFGVYSAGVAGNGGFGMVDMEETLPQAANSIPSLAFNILFNPGTTAAGTHGGYMGLTISSTPTQNVMTPANANHNDNYLGEPTLTSCGACTNQGKGYAAKFSVTPGANDISTSPNLVAWQRSIVLFDQDYLGLAACTAFSSGTTYAVGNCASIAVAGTYWSRTVNYRCIQLGCQSHQPGTFPTAASGSWKEWWEWNALSSIRAHLGVNYTGVSDGALAMGGNCTVAAPCSIIQALYEWISQGTVTQNPSNWGIDSGVDVGPVARSIVQHIMPMVVTP